MISLLLGVACVAPPDSAVDSVEGTPPGDSSPEDSHGSTDSTDSTPETGTVPRLGLLSLRGEATVTDTYVGFEDVVFTDPEAGDAELCRVRVQLESITTRTDCGICVWAFTLERRAVDVVSDVACEAVGWGDPAAMVGTTVDYGYTPDYYGHAPVLLSYQEKFWGALGFAFWDSKTGVLTYDLVDGYYPW